MLAGRVPLKLVGNFIHWQFYKWNIVMRYAAADNDPNFDYDTEDKLYWQQSTVLISWANHFMIQLTIAECNTIVYIHATWFMLLAKIFIPAHSTQMSRKVFDSVAPVATLGKAYCLYNFLTDISRYPTVFRHGPQQTMYPQFSGGKTFQAVEWNLARVRVDLPQSINEPPRHTQHQDSREEITYKRLSQPFLWN
jgi:hypothetical protein